MILHWLTTAWRSLIANPLFSLITIVSLSIGCCGALLAGSVIKQHLSFDRWVPHAERIAHVAYVENGETGQYFLMPGIKPALDGQLTGVAAISRVVPRFGFFDESPEGERSATLLVDPEYFRIFELRFQEGNPATVFEAPDSIVLTRRMADLLAGPGPALGKEVKRRETGRGERTYRISGVIDDIPPASHQRFDSLVDFAGEFDAEQQASVNLTIRPGGLYVRFADGVEIDPAIATANRQIGALMNETVNRLRGVPAGRQEFRYQVSLVPLPEVHLGGKHGATVMTTPDGSALAILAASALMLLAVSAFNYVTMSLARSMRRRREVAVRKVVGASGEALALHYFAESALVTAISLVTGFALAELLHPWFARTIGQPEVLFQLYDPVFLAISLAGFTLLAAAIGAYPAFYLARVRPRTALEEAGPVRPTLLGRALSGGLLGFQIFAATILLTFAITMMLQARYVADRPLGFSTRDIQFVSFYCPDGGRSEFVVQARCGTRTMEIIRGLPGVKQAAAFGGSLFRDNLRLTPFSRAAGSSEIGQTSVIEVAPNTLDVMQAKLLAGRMFDPNSAYDGALAAINPEIDKTKLDSAPVIVTRAMLRPLGADTPEAAIGQRIAFPGAARTVTSYEIVGVVEDWHQRSLRFPVSPIVFMPSGAILGAAIEIDPDSVPAAEAAMRKAWGEEMTGVNSNLRWAAATSDFELAYERDTRLVGAVASFAAVAMAVAALGVFGLTAFDMRRRVREIGIRKALGATPGKVAAMVIGQQLQFAAAASVLAWPVGYWLSGQWLHGYVYRTDKAFVAPLLATAIILAFVAVAVGLNTMRAAAVRPGAALKAA